MKRKVNNPILPIGIIIASSLVAAYIAYKPTLDTVHKFAGIIASASLVFALLTYFYNKKQNEIKAIAEQISFFREKVLSKERETYDYITGIKPGHIFTRVPMDTPTIKAVKKGYFSESKVQAELVRGDNRIMLLQMEILNMLEELAVRIRYNNIESHEALNSIKPAFVSIVEANAVTLLLQREIFMGNSIYEGTLHLYNLWKDSVDRRLPQVRLDEFLTKEENLE